MVTDDFPIWPQVHVWHVGVVCLVGPFEPIERLLVLPGAHEGGRDGSRVGIYARPQSGGHIGRTPHGTLISPFRVTAIDALLELWTHSARPACFCDGQSVLVPFRGVERSFELRQRHRVRWGRSKRVAGLRDGLVITSRVNEVRGVQRLDRWI